MADEEAKARLVRCPRCDCLIKELPHYSLYRCGSCGVVLRAKKKEEKGSEVSLKGETRRKERIFGEKTSVSSIADKGIGFLDGDDKNVREHRLDHDRTEKRDGYVDDYWAHQRHDHHDTNIGRSKSVNSSRENDFGVYSPRLDNLTRSLRLKDVERYGFGGFYKGSLETIDEGPSTYGDVSAYGYRKPVESFEYLDWPTGVRNFDRNRTRLLQKLDVVKDQQSRSHYMSQRPRELVPSGSIEMSPAHTRSAQYRRVSKLTYSNHKSMNVDEHMQNFYGNFHSVSKHARPETRGDCLSPGMHRRPHDQATHRNPQQRTYGYSSGQYLDFNENLAPYLNREGGLHHLPACSCLYCYDENMKGPLRVQPAGFGNRGSLKDPCSSTFNHYVSSNRVEQHYPPRPPVHLWPSDIDSDIDGFGRRHPRRVVLTSRNKQLCHPIAGGAPFITCYNCSELLRLPRKFRKMMNNEQRLQCGACSTVIVFEMEKKRLITSIPGNPNPTPTKAEETSTKLVTENHTSSHGSFNAGGTIEQSSKESQSPDTVIDWRDSPGSFELLFCSDISPAVSSLPIQELAKNPSSNETVSGYRDRTKPKHQEKVILVKNASQVVSGKDLSPVTTEAGVSFNGYRSSSSSRESLEASKEQNQLKLHKGSKSFLVGLVKKSFRDFSRSNEQPNVFVNGQPISDYVVKKAEKQAGPVHPGNYWYDSRAGFWGVMGQPCSGIIPPFIKEFDYPMPKNCAAGSTGVFINGRELHQKDLELLACKGFPTARDKSYIIEFSGRVVDEDSGTQLYALGKLAPTVEKEKRGFGMRVPGVVE
ncbi:hypothetical protein like AT2G46380 [Hibiscus trionum]|uniref:Zinc-ribbon domain-containing protein n=1 Tax=Hibiscus trionum TaxID=183268 RepID=A0A9W7J1T3_HIBTR|nr:hypothetical protein like AT2G46380 [Hibiscus trionum]